MALSRRSHTAFDVDVEAGDLPADIVDEITWFMREHKLSRADLACAMGVSPGRVSQILSGGENLTLRTLSSVVAALGGGARLDATLLSGDGDAPLPALG